MVQPRVDTLGRLTQPRRPRSRSTCSHAQPQRLRHARKPQRAQESETQERERGSVACLCFNTAEKPGARFANTWMPTACSITWSLTRPVRGAVDMACGCKARCRRVGATHSRRSMHGQSHADTRLRLLLKRHCLRTTNLRRAVLASSAPLPRLSLRLQCTLRSNLFCLVTQSPALQVLPGPSAPPRHSPPLPTAPLARTVRRQLPEASPFRSRPRRTLRWHGAGEAACWHAAVRPSCVWPCLH